MRRKKREKNSSRESSQKTKAMQIESAPSERAWKVIPCIAKEAPVTPTWGGALAWWARLKQKMHAQEECSPNTTDAWFYKDTRSDKGSSGGKHSDMLSKRAREPGAAERRATHRDCDGVFAARGEKTPRKSQIIALFYSTGSHRASNPFFCVHKARRLLSTNGGRTIATSCAAPGVWRNAPAANECHTCANTSAIGTAGHWLSAARQPVDPAAAAHGRLLS